MPYALNQSPATGAEAIWIFAQTATTPLPATDTARWKFGPTGGGTGGVYSVCGSVFTAAAQLANPYAWFVLQGPGYVTSPAPAGGLQYYRQLCFQRGASNASWRFKYSPRAGFSGGTPSPTVTPSATDEQILLGGGTDAAPTFGTLLPADGTYRMQVNVYEDSYGFYLATYPLGNATPNACLMMDPLLPGSYPLDVAGNSYEQDPVVIYQAQGASTLRAATLASESTGPLGWLNYNQPGALWTRLPCALLAMYDSGAALQVAIPAGLAQSSLTADLDVGRGTYARRALLGSTTGKKGDPGQWRWNAIAGVTSGSLLGQLDAYGGMSPYYWLVLGDALLRWDCVTTQVIL